MSQTPKAIDKAIGIKAAKTRARKAAKKRRAAIDVSDAGASLILHFPLDNFPDAITAGFWPLAGEIDILPLLQACHKAGHKLALPCTPPAGHPLFFRHWMMDEALKSGPYNTCEPYDHVPEITPTLVFVPMLAFTADGLRLGYGGGFYDRTLQALRNAGDVFACGVAYAGQEAAEIPVDAYDQKLDGILTDAYFRKLT